MLTITISAIEQYDDVNDEFIYSKEQVLELEHSLVSLSKWESKWLKPFLGREKTTEETIDYVRCMTITKNVDSKIYTRLSDDNIKSVHEYIDADMTATTFPPDKKGVQKKTVTSELIYYWMIALNIPFEPCQKWHLTRLLTLVNVCNIEGAAPKKMGKQETLSRNAALNEARRRSLNSEG